MKRITIKNHIQEIQLTTQRCIVAGIIILVLIVILLCRLAYLQMIENDLYSTLSEKNWLDIVPLEPTRGLIFDRNGILLAENVPVFSLDIIPYKINNLTQTLAEVAKIITITDTDIAQFHKELKQHRRFDEIPLKLRLTEDEVARFYENQYRFQGVHIKARLIRHYPLGGSFSHVLGYVGRINMEDLNDIDARNYSATNHIGKLGIEKFYEDELHGTVGYEQAENDVSGQPIRILNQTKPLPGKNLYLTIDSKLQLAAEQALAGQRGAIIIIQPSTGQILAMVSEPTFDPNVFVEGISNEAFQALQKSPDHPLYNRAIRGLYPIASPIKPFIALHALDAGLTNTSYTINDPGWYQLPNASRRFYDWKRGGHGRVNIEAAITQSCDTYFFDLAHRIGIKPIDHILNQFGFGQLTGVDLGEELPGIVASPSWKRRSKGMAWYEGDTLNSAIGQGYMQATPLQLANAIAAIGNRGLRFIPHLILSEQEPGKKAELHGLLTLDPVILQNEKNWDIVINAMEAVISAPQGTANKYFLRKIPYTMAGKTGTGQVYSIKKRNEKEQAEKQENLPEHLRDHSLFVGFAPVDKPQIAIAVVIENSKMAVIVAKKILDYYFLGPPPMPPPLISKPLTTPKQLSGENT